LNNMAEEKKDLSERLREKVEELGKKNMTE
jgi:hypothetical protein